MVLFGTHFFQKQPHFQGKVTGSKCQRTFTGLRLPRALLSILNFCADPTLLDDELNFDERPLKSTAFFVNNVQQIPLAKSQGAM